MRDHIVVRIIKRFFVVITRLNCFPGRLALGSSTDRKHVVHGCTTIDPDYTPAATPDQSLAACGSCLVCCNLRAYPKSSLNQCRGVWQR
ncbi:hypothetical protein TNCV_874151 [Trichonephila clavipes]|nr:hypothetical protein TNCV_874151 [Trichonephila clavipes]